MSIDLEAPPRLLAFTCLQEDKKTLVATLSDVEATILHVGLQNHPEVRLSPLTVYVHGGEIERAQSLRERAVRERDEALRDRDAFRVRVDALTSALRDLRLMGIYSGQTGDPVVPAEVQALVRSVEGRDAQLAGQMGDNGYNFGRRP